MSLKELSEKLYPAFIAAFKELSLDSCRLFLSATNMNERALVRNATADTPEEAWSMALKALEKVLSNKADEVSILRADWVKLRESTTWADCLEQIKSKRRNWFLRGIALDKEYRLAFTQQELNANLILYQPDKENTRGAFQRDKANAYCRKRFNCPFPKLNAMDEVEIFDTDGVFIQDDMTAPLSITGKGITGTRRDIPADDMDVFLKAAIASTDFLVRQCGANGKFIYGLNPCDDTIIDGYNTHRHFGTLYSMAEAYEFYEDADKKQELGAAIERGLEYAIRDLLVYRKTSDGENAAYFSEGRVTTVGISGLALLALTKWSEVSGTQKYFPLMRALGIGLIILQKPDGTFSQALNIKDFSVRKEFIISFYDGEALFGMLRLYAVTKDAKILDFVEKATQHFMAVNYQEKHDHWIQYAMNELTIWRPQREYFEFGLANIAEYLVKISKSIAHAPTQLEMIMAAENMIRRMKSLPEVKEFLDSLDDSFFYMAINRRATRLLNGFFWPEVAMYFPNPKRLLGGFFARSDAFRTRIDDSQHTISGLLAYNKYLKEVKPNVKPAKIETTIAPLTAINSIELPLEPTISAIETPIEPAISAIETPVEPTISATEPIKSDQMNRMIISAGSVRITIEADKSEPIKILTEQPQPVIIETEKKNNIPLRVGVLRKAIGRLWNPDSPSFTMFYTAKNFNIELLAFTPKDIDFANKTVNATILEGTQRIRKTVPLPKIIDNPASLFNGEYGKMLKTLEKDYFFTRHAEHTSKQNIYNMLLKDGRYKDLLIDTHTVEGFAHFMTLLRKYGNDVILKPAGGNEGKGVARITSDGAQYVINLKTDKITLKTVDDLKKFYDENFSATRHVLQPYITSRTRFGNPFDIRIHTRRGAGGKFKVSPYPRIGNENGVVSNVGSGGYTMRFDLFLKAEFGDDWKTLYDRIMELGNNFPEYYQTFFKSELFDVGIDLGIQKRGDSYELKIFEVNTYLGGSFVRVEDAVTRLEYYYYVAEKLRESGINV